MGTTPSRYTLSKRLGAGSYGVVFDGRSRDGGERVAIKRFDTRERGTAARDVLIDIFDRCAPGTAGHGVLQLLNFVEERGVAYLVTNMCTGGSLAALIEKAPAGRAVKFVPALAITYYVLHTLARLHSARIYHKNIKPSNILFEHVPLPHRVQEATVVLGDVGLPASEASAAVKRRAAPGASARYLAPELSGAPGAYSSKPDVFAVGVTLIDMLVVGRHALLSSAGRTFDSVREGLGVDTPLFVVELIRRFVCLDPAARPEAAEAAGAICEYLRHVTPSWRPFRSAVKGEDAQAAENALERAGVANVATRHAGAGAAATAGGAGSDA